MAGGMKFPIQINPITGRFMESDGAANIRESVYLILMTQKGERMARPGFGSQIQGYPFQDFSSTRRHMMEREVRNTILSQEPRVEDVRVKIEWNQDKAQVLVYVDYTVRDTGQTEHLDLAV